MEKKEIIQSLLGLVKLQNIKVSDPDFIALANFYDQAINWLTEELEKESKEECQI